MLAQNATQRAAFPVDSDPISWWSWRPGLKPRHAFLLGSFLSVIGLIVVSIGLFTLLLEVWDNISPPLQLPGTIIQSNQGSFSSPPSLLIHTQPPVKDIPAVITATVPATLQQRVHRHDVVTLLLSPHLHVAYALRIGKRSYMLPGVSFAGSLFGAAIFLLLGIVLFTYPSVLAHWGLRDLLIERYMPGRIRQQTAEVIARRTTAAASRQRRPGVFSGSSSTWHGVALRFVEQDAGQRLLTFRINEDIYRTIREDMIVHVRYSPETHYVYSITEIKARESGSEES